MIKTSKTTLTLLCALLLTYPHTSSAEEMIDYSIVEIRTLNKITARSTTIEIPIGESAEFGAIEITPRACRKAPPIEKPESAAFLQIRKKPKETSLWSNKNSDWLYSGWMFSSSPGLASMDHPIYDVWILDCLGEAQEIPKNDLESEETSNLKDSIQTEILENSAEEN